MIRSLLLFSALLSTLLLTSRPAMAIGNGEVAVAVKLGFGYATGDIGYVEPASGCDIDDCAGAAGYVVTAMYVAPLSWQLWSIGFTGGGGSIYATAADNPLVALTGEGADAHIDVLAPGGAIIEGQFTLEYQGFGNSPGDTGWLPYEGDVQCPQEVFTCATYTITDVNDFGSTTLLNASGGNNIVPFYNGTYYQMQANTGTGSLGFVVVNTDGSIDCIDTPGPCGYVIYAYYQQLIGGNAYAAGDIGQVLQWDPLISTGSYIVTAIDEWNEVESGVTFALTHGYYPGPTESFPDLNMYDIDHVFLYFWIYEGGGLPPALF